MKKIDWKAKLTSRKFWIAVAGLVTGLILAFRGNAETAETVSGIIMGAASVVAYILGEGLTDSARAGVETKDEEPEEDVETAFFEALNKADEEDEEQ